MEIKSIQNLNKYLRGLGKTKKYLRIEHKVFSIIKRHTFRGINFADFSWSGQYSNCKFIDCEFDKIFGFFLDLKNCTFTNCKFNNSRFSHFEYILNDGSWDNVEFEYCNFKNVRFDEGHMYNISFDDCDFELLKFDGLETTINVWFSRCRIDESFFYSTHFHEGSPIYEDDFADLCFFECHINDSMFSGCDFRNSSFLNSSIYKSTFIDCNLNSDTIMQDAEIKYPNYVSLDFQTILKSENLNYTILKDFFNIHSPDIKKLANEITTKLNFKTVFISYSFSDKIFANLLNEELLKNGIKTFLWEKDAPGGQLLEDIMENNIKKYDKVLFIASAKSIKSKACQFEISQARKKQETTWAPDTFFVVHIDNFLFEVQKNKIRPVAMADEYWENIQELRRFNSKDFSKFNTNNFVYKEFETAVIEIVSELKG